MWHQRFSARRMARFNRSIQANVIALIATVIAVIPLAACTMNPSLGATATTGLASTSTATTGTSSASTATTSTRSVTTTATPTTQSTATSVASPEATPVATTAPTAAPSPDASAQTVSVYFLRDKKIVTAHRSIPATPQVGTESLKELLKGPTPAETTTGLSSSVPPGTTLLGLSIANKVATVNLSSEFGLGGDEQSLTERLAQVVYTLTQFPNVTKVTFQLDGKDISKIGTVGMALNHEVGRSDYEAVTPAIFVEMPAAGDTVAPPIHLTGTANTFEAAFTIDILDAEGNLLTEMHAQATSGSGTRGTFDVSMTYKVTKKQAGKVVLFEVSAKDGAKINQVEIPVTLTP
ncbi:MAG TPA: GerMN domain-containing protein [Nitrolancea sp.]|nr:GerMN domain-containing protein [Nitrolancea sp.]